MLLLPCLFKVLYPNLDTPVPALSPNKNPLDISWSKCGQYLYIDQMTGKCCVNTWDGLCAVPGATHIYQMYQKLLADERNFS